jgi:hypothetical protein
LPAGVPYDNAGVQFLDSPGRAGSAGLNYPFH